MADALARYGPTQAAIVGTTLITAGGAGTYTVVRHVHVVNATATTAWITLGVNGVAAANALVWQLSVAPGDFFDWTGNIPLIGSLTTPDTLQMIAQTALALTVTVGAVTGP